MADMYIPDVREHYFQHKQLTRTVGQPIHAFLRILTIKLKANASSVPSTLGGGIYGHTGLILSADQYSQLSSEEFKVPTNPGALTPPEKGTAAHNIAQKDA